MFDFEKLDVYYKAQELNEIIVQLLKTERSIDSVIRNQLRRASLSIILNLAEGSGKLSMADKRNFYFIARGSTYECTAIFETLKYEKIISREQFQKYYNHFELVSKMILGLIQSLSA